MKKALLYIIGFIIFPLSYVGWPIYQGLAYRGMAPMIPFNYEAWPVEQPASNEIFDQRFQQIADRALSALKQQQAAVSAPGYTAAVAIDGETLWAGSVGWADIANRVEMTTETQLRIGSTSKALTATGLARLVESEQLNLDAPLSEYFSPLLNPDWARITARQLASHMAGVPHYGENNEILGKLEIVAAQTHFPDVLDALALFDESDLLFKPGEQFSYSSLGTVLLSALMQIKAEVSYQTYMQESVFDPLGMVATFTETPTITSDNLAKFYWQNQQNPTELKRWYDVDLSHRLAGGGWVSTSKDLVKLGQGFLNQAYISAPTREMFWTPQPLNSGEVNHQNYGIGWRIHTLELGEGFRPLTFMHHGGVSAGAQSFLMVIPEYNLSLAVNANVRTEIFSDFAKVSYELARLFIAEIERQKS